jgi:hypothetical protein
MSGFYSIGSLTTTWSPWGQESEIVIGRQSEPSNQAPISVKVTEVLTDDRLDPRGLQSVLADLDPGEARKVAKWLIAAADAEEAMPESPSRPWLGKLGRTR